MDQIKIIPVEMIDDKRDKNKIEDAPWMDALEGLYLAWCEVGVSDKLDNRLIDDLMKLYDEWLD